MFSSSFIARHFDSVTNCLVDCQVSDDVFFFSDHFHLLPPQVIICCSLAILQT